MARNEREVHQRFKDADHLNHTLLADTDGNIARQFGVRFRAAGRAMVKPSHGESINAQRRLAKKNFEKCNEQLQSTNGQLAEASMKLESALKEPRRAEQRAPLTRLVDEAMIDAVL